MAGGGDKGGLYAVLGVASDCSDAELRSAYRKLAMTWHPDKHAAAGSTGCVEAAKVRFQNIQSAYAVLSDPNKRILYDVGAYDSDCDCDDDGVGEVLGDILEAMSQQTSTKENGSESLEDLQKQFEELFLKPDTAVLGLRNRRRWHSPVRRTECASMATSSAPGQVTAKDRRRKGREESRTEWGRTILDQNNGSASSPSKDYFC